MADTGHEKVHRRSLYTFWKRTAPPPQMSIIDAPSREACMVRRERTNTPLQALLLMNDTQYVECSRVLAERVLRETGEKPEARLTAMFRMATSRTPDQQELSELLKAFQEVCAWPQEETVNDRGRGITSVSHLVSQRGDVIGEPAPHAFDAMRRGWQACHERSQRRESPG